MSDTPMTNRELRPLEEYQLIDSIEVVETGGDHYRLFINGHELPFHIPETYRPYITTDLETGMGIFTLELLTEPEVTMRQMRHVESDS